MSSLFDWQKNCSPFKPMVKLTREMVVANLYVMKIHLLIVKLLIVKDFFA